MRRFFSIIPVIFAISIGLTSSVFALGLGDIRIRSQLGQSFLAYTELVSADPDNFNLSCVRARLVSVEGTFLANVTVALNQSGKRRALTLSTRQAISEPAIKLLVDVNCETQLHREFSILLDPPDAEAFPNQTLKDNSPFANSSGNAQEPVKESTQVGIAAENKANSVSDEGKKKSKRIKKERVELSVGELDASKEKPKHNKKPARDVLKLSDDVSFSNDEHGLKMSDALSSEAGQALVSNMSELREAQARMAAILRDEAPVVSTAAPKLNEGSEIASLKTETDKLRKQGLQDKAALEELQKKNQFDLWVVILSIVAIISVAIIILLLLYIRRHAGGSQSTWWEGKEEEDHIDDESIEDVIDKVQASYSASNSNNSNFKSSSQLKPSNSEENKAQSNDALDADTVASASLGEASNTGTPTLEDTNSSIFNFFLPRGSSVKVEEISDVTQEAEFWISMNDPQRAIEILEPQEEIEHPDSPLPWLFLLDLYRTVHNPEKYNLLRDRFIIFFNAKIPEYDEDLSQMEVRQLEDFPHLVDRISRVWNGNDVVPYLESLLVDDREGKRAGFDLPVYRDILMLLGVAHEIERMKANDSPQLPGSEKNGSLEAMKKEVVDPVQEAEISTIEFEVIDFPKMNPKKK